MKITRILTSLCFLTSGLSSYAQNTFPATGKVGIGVTNPWAALDVRTTGAGSQNALNIQNPATGAYTTVDLTFSSGNVSSSIISAQRNNLGLGSSLFFQTSDNAGTVAPRMWIDPVGNVGIGTLEPAHKLDVNGDIRAANSVFIDGGDLIINRTTQEFGYIVRPNVAERKALAFAVLGGGALEKVWFNSARSYFSGKIGVGTFNPGGELQVSDGGDDGTKYGSLQIVRAASPSDNAFHISFIRNGNNVSGIGYVNNSSTLGLWQANTNAGTPLMSFTPDQTVGIRTTDTKGYALAVNGNAIFLKVKVQQLPWADYVFNDDYHLRPLDELEQFIKINRHLPEMPTTKDVEEKGLDVGDNQALLLKKIEELSLYIIEQNKQIQKMQSEIDALKK